MRPAGATCWGDREFGYRANLWLRSAIRVQRLLLRGPARDPEELYDLASEINWAEHLSTELTFAIDGSVRSSRITHSLFAALKVKDAIVDQFQSRRQRRPNVDKDNPDIPIKLHIERDVASFYLNTSGGSLHKRGWRPIQVRSPINEALAAGLILMTGWDTQSPIFDPMCGSGTFLIEAAWMALDRAPGLHRRFPFMLAPDYDERLWRQLHREAEERIKTELDFFFEGGDHHAGALELAERNARLAGVGSFVRFQRGDARDLVPDQEIRWVMTNPPYGERLGEGDDLIDSWVSLGNFLHRQLHGGKAFVLSGNPELSRHLGLKSSRRHPVRNGPIDCRWLEYDLRPESVGEDEPETPVAESRPADAPSPESIATPRPVAPVLERAEGECLLQSSQTPPRAEKRDSSHELHGVTIQDPYSWLRDDDWQTVLRDPSKLSPEIREYLEAENAYTASVMAKTKPFQDFLFEELKGRIKEDDSSVPAADGPWEYYRRFAAGAQYPLYCRRPRGGGDEQVLLDVPTLAEGREFCKVASVTHSTDHRYLAYAVDFLGSEKHELRFRDLTTGEELSHVIPETSGSVTWAVGAPVVYYVVLDDNHRTRWVRRYRLGTAVDSAETLYEEADQAFFVGVTRTESNAFVLLNTHDHSSSEVHVLPADDPEAAFTCLEPRQKKVEYDVSHRGARFYILLRSGDEKDGAIYTTSVMTPGRAHWKPFIPHQEGVLIEGLLMFESFLVRHETRDALPRLVVRDLESSEEHEIAFDEQAYDLSLVPGYEFSTPTLRFVYDSMTTPAEVYDYDMRTRERVLRKRQEIPSGHDPAQYETLRLFAPARDGESIPISLLRRKDSPRSPETPVLLYGYGSYGISMPASFSPHRLSLVDRGFTFAIAHIRGGKERGYAWYEQAKLAQKPLTFSDFEDSARFLVREGYTRDGRIVAMGGSAGGMLMGAVANRSPELFGAVIAQVPFVDVLNTMCDATLPLTPPEWPEWGNPIESREEFESILSFSPYDNVSAQDYPAMLILAGLTDPRVTYWEPAKWVARLRELKTDDRPLVLDMDMGAGHGGKSGRFEYLRKLALEWTFALEIMGLL